MASLLNVDLVRYLCSCGKKYPISKLYFCRHCLKTKCADCVQHETDCPYCPNCMTNMSASDARLNRNRCSACYDCPACGHILTKKATSQMVARVDGQSNLLTKMFYLACGYCRWSTRDTGISDKSSFEECWHDQVNPNSAKINSWLDLYRKIAQQEKSDKERKKYIKRKSQALFQIMTDVKASVPTHVLRLCFKDTYGLTDIALKGRFKSTFESLSVKDSGDLFSSTEKIKIFDPLPADIFTKSVILQNVTRLDQRLRLPEFQPSLACDLWPVRKQLHVRRSLRCRECQHNLCKPEFNPYSIKFKIQLIAMHYIPELKIMAPARFVANKETVVTFTLTNPSIFKTVVKLMPVGDASNQGYMTAEIVLPKCDLVLSCLDDTAVCDDGSRSEQESHDDPRIVVFRAANKIGFVAKVIPFCAEGEVKVSFLMVHEYRSTATAVQGEHIPKVELLGHRLFVSLGHIQQDC